MATNGNEEEAELVVEKADEHVNEVEALLPSENLPEPKRIPFGLTPKAGFSVSINVASAVGLVFVNKRIFEDDALRHAQVTFAATHFAITAATLYAVSTPPIALFQRKRIGLLQILPLAFAMIFAVVLTNASLAFSSIQFYQIARVLVTPCVALLEFMILRKKIPVGAALTLIPVCVGVGIVSYFDTSADPKAHISHRTTPLGVFFAMVSLVASATYTVLIKKYHDITKCKSAQLLLNQSPASVLIMLYIIPFSDDVTVWRSVSLATWAVILMSGILACLLHISQFLIVDGAGPVAIAVPYQIRVREVAMRLDIVNNGLSPLGLNKHAGVRAKGSLRVLEDPVYQLMAC
ncbi:hypothetical protein B0A55_03059 [Friedmanniomyces simplex]|uniref:GDP-mannose transporter n=1 Tax=Friedmanniomyces simplex TaxID=329884 RepID=A0A4U0XM82_9PEZI|nr:hypothetical protein B0A55_03059 [Friedmanniomyces simplex]